MIKFNQLIRHYGKMFILFLATLFLLAGCAAKPRMRVFGFSQNNYTNGGVEKPTSVTVKDFEIMFDSTIKSANNPQETTSLLKKRLQDQLLAMDLNPVTEGNAAYHLSGQLAISEKHSTNGWIVPMFIVGIGLMPISLFIIPHFPIKDVHYKTVTNTNLLHADSGKVIWTNSIEKNDKIKVPEYHTIGIQSPKTKTNKTLVRIIDGAIQEIGDEISQAIMEDKTARSMGSTASNLASSHE